MYTWPQIMFNLYFNVRCLNKILNNLLKSMFNEQNVEWL